MATPQPRPDDARGNIALLTAKERECLHRWLCHATAKEIALELGISHHAVEKRLKSARQKLGVATTLQAARLLAREDGYGRTAYCSSELSGPAQADHLNPGTPAADLIEGGSRKPQMLSTGVLIMTMLILAALALTAQNADKAAPAGSPAEMPRVFVLDRNSAKPQGFDEALSRVFGNLDKNGSGYLEPAEYEKGQLRMIQGPRGTTQDPTQDPNAVGARIADWDGDGDRRVSPGEFRIGISGLIRPRVR